MQCLVDKEHAVANVNRIRRLTSPPKDYKPFGSRAAGEGGAPVARSGY